MNIITRKFMPSDMPFMHKMLYEAIYWMKKDNYPSFEEAMADESFLQEFTAFGSCAGDLAVIAESDHILLGSAWTRCWNEEDNIRGYISPNIPILAIAVAENYRDMGIGKMLIDALKAFAKDKTINKISLCVTKSNYAYSLYKKCGFSDYKDIGDSIIMLLKL